MRSPSFLAEAKREMRGRRVRAAGGAPFAASSFGPVPLRPASSSASRDFLVNPLEWRDGRADCGGAL